MNLLRITLRSALVLTLSCGGADTPPASTTQPVEAGASADEASEQPSARQFGAWLDAFNSGDAKRYGAFLTSNFPSRASALEPEMHFREMTGGFDLREIERASATEVSGLVQERDSEQFARFSVEVEPSPPHQIVAMELHAVSRPAAYALPRVSAKEAVDGVAALLDKNVAADKFAGAVLVAKDGEVLLRGAYGSADREQEIANTIKTSFRIGSMNKMFTAVAILQLVEAGKIELAAPLGRYLKDYPNNDVATKVTIHHLLTHTGGTGDIFGPEFDAHRTELRELDDYVALYGERGLAFEPGSQWVYSNYGMLLLGVVIEKVAHQTYYEYVQRHIYERAGMTGSGSLPEEQSVPGRSKGYTKQPGTAGWIANDETLPYRGTSAGGGYSTVDDLFKFAAALSSHALLSADSTELLLTGKVQAGPGSQYAYGFADQRDADGYGSVGHGGGAPGMNGDLRIYPRSGFVVVVLANVDPPAAQRITDYLDARLPRD